jgi:uncharacterized membrane protein
MASTKQSDGRGLANFLGWFSMGLGLAETIAPRAVARMIGTRPDASTRNLLRACGAREIASGLGILSQSRTTDWLKSRVVGDAIDAALLLPALKSRGTDRTRTMVALLAVVGAGALDLNAVRHSRASDDNEELEDGEPAEESGSRGIQVRQSLTINQPLEQVYLFWRDFSNLPRFMRHIAKVEKTGGARSRWTIGSLPNVTAEWDVVVIEDLPNEVIAWQTAELTEITSNGRIRFRQAPGGRGTEIHVEMSYHPAGGRLTNSIRKLFHKAPEQQLLEDLRLFKQIMETGEVLISDATINRGRPHAARPPAASEIPETLNATSRPAALSGSAT